MAGTCAELSAVLGLNVVSIWRMTVFTRQVAWEPAGALGPRGRKNWAYGPRCRSCPECPARYISWGPCSLHPQTGDKVPGKLSPHVHLKDMGIPTFAATSLVWLRK